MLVDFETVISFFLAIYFLFLLGRLIMKKRTKNNKYSTKSQFIFRILFHIYAIVLIAITVFPIELPPMRIYNYLDLVNLNVLSIFKEPITKHFMLNLFGNLVMFVPLCYLYNKSQFSKKMTMKTCVVLCIFLSIGIETVQFFENYTGLSSIFARSVDIVDVILNVLGGIIGCWMFSIYEYMMDKNAKSTA